MSSKFKPITNVQKDNLHISFSKKAVTGTLTVHTFIDNGHFVSYCPTLQLSAYGDNKKEAMDRLVYDVIDDFFAEIVKDVNLTFQELEKLGWKNQKLFKKRFTSETYVDREGVLRNFNLPDNTLIETSTISNEVTV